ncbi:MAG: heme-copper oxidase subunit III [Chloracidobacterium sp.]|nr:heme-copper oxidase subunit III [Chloracidobacterium sp.]
MEVGTAEIINDIEEPKKRRTGLSGGPSFGSGGGNNGGGGDNSSDDAPNDTLPFNSQKPRILTFFLLLAILMTFGGLIAAYVVIATNNVAEWRPFDLPIQVWISTVIILLSSATYHLGKVAIDRNNQKVAKNWLIATTALGAAFISSQIMAWLVLTNRGLYMGGNPYAGFFYILTAVHVVHVIGGIIALGSILLNSWLPTSNEQALIKRKALAQVVGWYWHFMGGLWLVLFVLLGFWK